MAKYRKKPVEVEAVQVSWKTWDDVCGFIEAHGCTNRPPATDDLPPEEASDTLGETGHENLAGKTVSGYIRFELPTTPGEMAVFRHGDWVLPDSRPGTFYPVKPDVFEATYEPVEET